MKSILKYVKTFILLLAAFFVFSILSCLIPYDWVRENIERSLPELVEDGNYPNAVLKGVQYREDNFTDALILNIIVSSDSKRPVWSALTNPFSFQAPDTEKWYAITHLEHKVNNIDLPPDKLYGRYWFGTAAATKILLIGMRYQQIKRLLYIVSTLLLLVFAVKMVNKVGWIKSLPIFLALLFANFFVTQFSLQFFPVMAIALLGGIWMCENGLKSQEKITMFMLITGMFTAYFDLITTPLLTLGLPLIVYLILQEKEEKSIWKHLQSLFIFCSFWFIGFAGAWIMKWVLAYIFADAAAFNMAYRAIKWSTATDGYTRWDAIVANVKLLPLLWLSLVLVFLFILTLLSFNKKGIPLAIAFLVVGLLPYGMYVVLPYNAYPHWWFTYRSQVITMSCAMLFFVSLIDWEQLKLKLKIKNSIKI
jgi:hypothetical protein